jgi:hypothetical protein
VRLRLATGSRAETFICFTVKSQTFLLDTFSALTQGEGLMKNEIIYVVYSHSRAQLGRLCFLGWGDTKEDAMINAYGDLENARRWLRKRDGAMVEAFERSDAYAMFGEWEFMG